MARTRFALYASASFHGEVVEETFVRTGEAIQIGNSPTLAVPVPAGAPYLARVLWTGPASCVVQDAAGQMYPLEPGKDVVIELGAVMLRLYLVEQFPIRRAEPWSLQASLAWFAVVVLSTVVTLQAVWVDENHCMLAIAVLPRFPDVGLPLAWVLPPLVGAGVALAGLLLSQGMRQAAPALVAPLIALGVPVAYQAGGFQWKSGEQVLADEFGYCMGQQDQQQGTGALTAEYLARLLREDFEGERVGTIEMSLDRPEAERPTEERVFMPAGQTGPIKKMGGADEVAPEPVRTPLEETVPLPARKKKEQVPLFAERGTPVPAVPAEEVKAEDGLADGFEEQAEDPEKAPDTPAEEEKGWGIPDWYDEEDRALDELQIDLMLRAARHRLAIDPNDPDALSILAYYQYLATDYEAANRTYDKFISLYPEEAAGYNNKALVYKRQGAYQKEEGLYRVALSLEPLDETALNNLAVNLAHQGRYEEALAVMDQLEVIDPNDPYADLHRAKIHADMGNDEKALEYLELALKGMQRLDTLHHIEFRQDIRLDPSFERLRQTYRFRAILSQYYGKDSPLQE